MDGARFDHLTRLLGAGASRRRVVQFLGGLAAGGIASLVGFRRLQAVSLIGECESSDDCQDLFCCNGVCLECCLECCKDEDCASGTCCSGSCREVECCVEDGDPNPRCPSGYSCVDGACYIPNCNNDLECENGICCSGSCLSWECCAPNGNADPRCPSGYVCNGGLCQEASGCSSDDQCDGICCGGECVPTECCADDPDTTNHCPSGYSCVGGVCVEPKCSSDDQCSGGFICCQERCEPLECCSADVNPDARCPSGYICLFDQCISTSCATDDDCAKGICCGGSCTAGVTEYECCIVDPNPNARCPSGTICFEGICSPPGGEGGCCAILRAGGVCKGNGCCTLTASPNDYCPSGSSCEPRGSDGEGICCVPSGAACLSDTPCCGVQHCLDGVCASNSADPTPGAEPTAGASEEPIDKWELWTGKEKLAGATLYLRRLTAEDDPKVMGSRVVGPDYRQTDFDRLAKLGANYVELSHPAPRGETAPYDEDEAVQKQLDRLIGFAEQAGLFVVISFRTGPGRSERIMQGVPVCQAGGCFSGGPFKPGGGTVSARLWSDDEVADAWIDLWKTTADRYKENPVVIGYHLLAMPDASDAREYRTFLQRTTTAIRGVDADTPVLISAPGAGRPGDLTDFPPLGDDRTLYRVDAFAPARYLTQPSDADNPLVYGEAFDPLFDEEDGEFDDGWLQAFLKPALIWAAKEKQWVAVGGYGIPRWQPGLATYLDDLLDLAAKNELRATLWLWQPAKGPTEDDAFNLEHGTDPDKHEIVDNPLVDVLKKHWKGAEARPSTVAATSSVTARA